MDIEEIAKLDLFLRNNKGAQHLLDIDDLIISENDPNSVTKLKLAAQRLTKLDHSSYIEIKETWINLFSQQVRFSVRRAKEKANKI
jgi:hypothetical protein